MNELTELQADYIRQLYLTPFGEMIQVKPWRQIIFEDAYTACCLIAPTLAWEGTVVSKVIASDAGVYIEYRYKPFKLSAETKKGVAKFSFDKIPDPMLWQFLVHCKYPVRLFIEPNHPLNGSTVLTLGLGVEKHSS